ncbi:MAG TPA: ATP-binding protein [Solirubrobacteraceae bacterium]|jgi:serine/threonine-protein kinase RsbW|nr:ATP-binding protein [Solirubrobacteraceae bacterium]
MAENPNVRLTLSNRPENVLLVRQALRGVADAIALDAIELNDISTAVSEACNNVAAHAYDGDEGPLEVEIEATREGLVVIVRDRGTGIRPSLRRPDQAGGGIGLPVIRALAQRVEFIDLDGGGTEVSMQFATSKAALLADERSGQRDDERAAMDETLASTIAMTIAPTSLARTVLPRIMGALAARAYFSTDRISDTQTLADALVEHTDGAIAASHLNVGVSVAPRNLALCIGPLLPGRGSALVGEELDELGEVLERLADRHEVSPDGPSSEMLALHMADPR